MSLSNPKRVSDQYRNPSNLNARITLHRRFTVSETSWHEWVFDQLNLPAGTNLLEIGCGPADLWTSNRGRIPQDARITLTDASPGILAAAKSILNVNLSFTASRNFTFTLADAEGLPFEADSFDAVVANHVLHHVPDLEKALSEIARVLKPGGTLYAATNGAGHLRELAPHARRLDPDYEPAILSFNLQNGAEQLSPLFSRVFLKRHESFLRITEAKPLVDYLLSTLTVQTATRRFSEEELRRRVVDLSRSVEAELEREGEIFVRKDAGMFVAEL